MTASGHNHDHKHEETVQAELVAPTRPHPHAIKKGADGHSAEEVGVLRLDRIIAFLEAHFGEVEGPTEIQPVKMDESEGKEEMEEEEEGAKPEEAGPALVIKLDEYTATIGLLDMVSEDVLPIRISFDLKLVSFTDGARFV